MCRKVTKIKEEKWDDNKVGGDNMGLFGTEDPTSVAAQCDQVLMAARSPKAWKEKVAEKRWLC